MATWIEYQSRPDAATASWYWLQLDTGAVLEAHVVPGDMQKWRLTYAQPGEQQAFSRTIRDGSIEDLQSTVRGWLGEELHGESSS